MNSQTLREARKYEEATEKIVTEQERPAFHLSSRIGWMNDPNGFSIYQGQYHMFYQYHPYSCIWGPMHWGHAVSRDLLHWEYLPAAIAPDCLYDRDGCFSGSAIEMPDGRQLLMYTGVYNEVDPAGGKKEVQTQCIAIGDGRSISSEDLIAGFRGSTKARGVCDGSTKDAHHHGEAARIGCVRGSSVVEDKEIESDAAQHIEQDDTHRHQVQLHASFLEALEEAWTYLQAYAIDEEDESEVLNEGQYIICSRKAEVSGHDTCEEHEGDTQRDATHLNASQTNTNGDDQRIEQNDVCHAIGRKKQRLQPIHNI